MLKLTIAVLACIVALSNGQSIVPKADFHPKDVGILALDGFQQINCASTADGIQDIRLQGCTSAPCQLSRGQTYSLEVDFRSRDQHWDMTLRAVFLQGQNLQVTAADVRLDDSTLNPGQLYTFRYTIPVPSGSTGAHEFRLKLYQNYVHEVCLNIPVNIV